MSGPRPEPESRQESDETCGVVYFCIGEKYLNEAVVSAESLKRHMPTLRTAIFCDDRVPESLFDIRLGLSPGLHLKRQKIHALLNSPFDRTLYLDTDTFIADSFWEVFHLLDRFELAMALAPTWSVKLGQGNSSVRGVPVSFPTFNAGVIAFRNSPSVRSLLERWDRLYVEWGSRGQDQPALRVALYESDLRWATLPPAYNYRLPNPAAIINGKVKIFHGRHPELALLCERLNVTDEFRGSAPLRYRGNVTWFGVSAVKPTLEERAWRWTFGQYNHETTRLPVVVGAHRLASALIVTGYRMLKRSLQILRLRKPT